MKMTLSLSNLIPPCVYYLTNIFTPVYLVFTNILSIRSQSGITPCSQVPHPHKPQLAKPSQFFPKKRDSFFCWSSTQLVLSAVAGRIKRIRWHPQTAHHLALCWVSPFSGRSSGWGAASITLQRRWGKIGVKLGYCRHWVIYLAPINPPVHAARSPSTEHAGVWWGWAWSSLFIPEAWCPDKQKWGILLSR